MVPAEIEDSDSHIARPPTATTSSHDGEPIWGSNSIYKKNLQNKAIYMRPPCSPLHLLAFSPDHCLTLVLVMAAPVAIAVYMFAFLILVIYTIDTIVQWRNSRERSWKYFSVQVILVIYILLGKVVLVVYNKKEVKPAILHGLQALSLLLSLIINVCIFPEANSPLTNHRYRLWYLRDYTLDVQPSWIFGDISHGYSSS